MTKYTEKLEEIKRNYRYKKDELFKRLKVSTFAQLVIQVATLSDETLKGPPEEGQKLDEGDATLSRTMNPYTNSILEYKNAHGKIIILYDDDERVASQAATTMCERGFENLFMLSGGLRVIAQKIPEGLVTGSFPASCLVASQPGSARKKATPQPPLLQATQNKWRFTAEDLQKIQYHLQEEQFPSDPASRLSRGSSARDCKAVAVKSSQNLPSLNPATAPLTTRSLSSSSLQSRPWR
uniref:Rhodanese domain-containing protein n=1 Tax=Micrurus spixii TaxID=129469 RepID=A0A2D4N5S9_9SAUR